MASDDGDSSENVVVKYLECLRRDHPRLGNGVLDGCTKFEPSGEKNSLESVFCANCSCNRNYHRMVELPLTTTGAEEEKTVMVVEEDEEEEEEESSRERKRSRAKRTNLTADQKEKLTAYAEAVAWRPRWRDDDGEILRLCMEVGISRDVFKNWINNNRKRRQKRAEIGQPSVVVSSGYSLKFSLFDDI